MRPTPWNPKPIHTAFMDYETGYGVTSDGVPFKAAPGARRQKPNLVDKLNAAAQLRVAGQPVTRIFLTGKVPRNDRNTRHWLLTQTPGWETPRGHWLGTPPTGRFDNIETGQRIDVKVSSEWFGKINLTPNQARSAWSTLESILSHFFRSDLTGGSPLMLTPAATGQNLWATSLPKNYAPIPVDPDIAEDLHRTSTQHHLDHLVLGPAMPQHPDVVPMIDPRHTPQLDGFAYTDGRFMYSALCSELGTGPGHRLTAKQCEDLWRENQYVRARFAVEFTVPDTWEHVGIFGIPFEDKTHGWYYPNRPGATGQAWIDASELFVAQKFGWHFRFLEGILFTTEKKAQRKRFEPGADEATRRLVNARPLDTWANRLSEAREVVDNRPDLHPAVAKAISAALRAIVIQSIGAFASRGRSATAITYDHTSIPGKYLDGVIRKGNAFIYTLPQNHNPRQQAFYRPEFAVQVWGRGRARVLHHTVRRKGFAPVQTGALTLPGRSIIGINGDAIYSSVLPSWSLPEANGGADDGRAGLLRLQGWLPGPVKTPVLRADRDKLRDRAVKAGYTPGVDEAVFEHEFIPPEDALFDYDVFEEDA